MSVGLFGIRQFVALTNCDDSHIFYVWNVPSQHEAKKGILKNDYCMFNYFAQYFVLSRNDSIMEVSCFIWVLCAHMIQK